MIQSIKIKNLRSLGDTGFLQIKPITLLLGANSSGKSTFLRSFPLLTQSVNKYLRGPISWFDDSLVDFGDYKTAFNKYANPQDKIQFYYDMSLLDNPHYLHYNRIGLERLLRQIKSLEVSFSLSNDDKGTFISGVRLAFEGITIMLRIPDRMGKVDFSVNGMDVALSEQNVRWNATTYNTILPKFDFELKDSNSSVWFSPGVNRNFYPQIINFVRVRSDSRLKNFSRVDALIERWEFDKNKYLQWLIQKSPIPSFKKYVASWTIDDNEFLDLYNLVTLYNVLPIWDLIDTELSKFYMDCSYIAPTRAEANRYYRTQGLQVNDIDPYGKNLQEFISSLTPAMQNSYNKYTETTLGIKAKTKTETGHQSIIISNERGDFNITDVGFGYSQILPIVTKLWYAMNKRQFRRRQIYFDNDVVNSLLLMEQPELHLHPAYQAKIADAFVNTVIDRKEKQDGLRLIIETHSDTILNRIGRRVREGVIQPSDINIILFEKGKDGKTTVTRQTTFNKKGQVEEWPYGFFDPTED